MPYLEFQISHEMDTDQILEHLHEQLDDEELLEFIKTLVAEYIEDGEFTLKLHEWLSGEAQAVREERGEEEPDEEEEEKEELLAKTAVRQLSYISGLWSSTPTNGVFDGSIPAFKISKALGFPPWNPSNLMFTKAWACETAFGNFAIRDWDGQRWFIQGSFEAARRTLPWDVLPI